MKTCKPDTAYGPGECGKPASFYIPDWPSYGSTWSRTETLYLCREHAEKLGWHYGVMYCLTCNAEVRHPKEHDYD